MASKAALIDFLASTRVDVRDGDVWDDGAIVAFFVPGTSTGNAVWLDRDKTLPTGAGIEQTTLDADGGVTVFGDSVYDIKIYDSEDTGLTNPLKTFPSVNAQDAQVGATLTDPDFLDGTDPTKIASWDMSLVSSGTTRTIKIPDADTTLLGTSETAVFQNKLFEDATCKWVDNGDNTKAVNYEISGATSGKTTTLDFNHSDDRVLTFPDASGTIATTSDLFPSGGIIIWSGAISAIPLGWLICDGTGGTPDLTDRFVIHADADAAGTNNVGDLGGSTNTGAHAITEAQLPAHDHPITSYSSVDTGGALAGIDVVNLVGTSRTSSVDTAVTAGNAGSGATHLHTVMPKYYALAYIMKA